MFLLNRRFLPSQVYNGTVFDAPVATETLENVLRVGPHHVDEHHLSGLRCGTVASPSSAIPPCIAQKGPIRRFADMFPQTAPDSAKTARSKDNN